MLKQTLILFSAIMLLVACGAPKGEKAAPDGVPKKITIKGTVKFDEPQFKMEIYQYVGFDKNVIAEFDINPDGTYLYEMDVKEPGAYTLDCKKWEEVTFWAEDENIEVNFRGKDTAKMVIKNPPYRHIEGAGPLNEVMNQMNFIFHRNYQLMIGMNRVGYNIFGVKDPFMRLCDSLYSEYHTDINSRLSFIATSYADRKSILAVLPALRDEKFDGFKAEILAKLESAHPNYAPLLNYKKDIEEALYQKERLAIGKPAPDFSFPTPEGDKKIGLKDFKGKFLVVDFWASWCGPCRMEIPHMKEVYAKYKSKGVEILGVSIDKKDSDWKKALGEEKMIWSQVCAPDAGKDIMKDYQFSGIPYIILLDKEGNILAKGLRGEGIDAAIEEALKNNK